MYTLHTTHTERRITYIQYLSVRIRLTAAQKNRQNGCLLFLAFGTMPRRWIHQNASGKCDTSKRPNQPNNNTKHKKKIERNRNKNDSGANRTFIHKEEVTHTVAQIHHVIWMILFYIFFTFFLIRFLICYFYEIKLWNSIKTRKMRLFISYAHQLIHAHV